jgi:hypothetical protein
MHLCFLWWRLLGSGYRRSERYESLRDRARSGEISSRWLLVWLWFLNPPGQAGRIAFRITDIGTSLAVNEKIFATACYQVRSSRQQRRVDRLSPAGRRQVLSTPGGGEPDGETGALGAEVPAMDLGTVLGRCRVSARPGATLTRD